MQRICEEECGCMKLVQLCGKSPGYVEMGVVTWRWMQREWREVWLYKVIILRGHGCVEWGKVMRRGVWSCI